MKSWFGCFVTRLDQEAEMQLPLPLEENELMDLSLFIKEIKTGSDLTRDATCRFAYQNSDEKSEFQFYVNGCAWDTTGVSHELLSYVANNRHLTHQSLATYLNTTQNQIFIYNLWKLQWLYVAEN